MTNLDSILKSRGITLPTKGHLVNWKTTGFSSGHVWMWELDCKESWALKNWWFWTVVLEKTLESPLDCKEIQAVHPKGNQSWIFIGRTDAEAETPILLPPDVKNWAVWKDLDVGEDWRQDEKGMTEVEMVGWHHRLDGQEFEQAPGVGDGQGSLACCSPLKSWAQLSDWTKLNPLQYSCLESLMKRNEWITLFSLGNCVCASHGAWCWDKSEITQMQINMQRLETQAGKGVYSQVTIIWGRQW